MISARATDHSDPAAAAIAAFVPYLPPERHGIIGDRRSCAIVGADGTICWLCLPRYDGEPIFGALLDADRGGHWRMGPRRPSLGSQCLVERTWSLTTRWSDARGDLELRDTMLDCDRQGLRAVVRQLACVRGSADCVFDLSPRRDFCELPPPVEVDGALMFRFGARSVRAKVYAPIPLAGTVRRSFFELHEGESVCAVLMVEGDAVPSLDELQAAIRRTETFWRDTCALPYTGPRRERIIRSALTVHLLSYPSSGAVVAAPTTSMPERIGGDWNFDYRFTWIRDASLSLATLAMLGDPSHAAARYVDWMCRVEGTDDAPLQVLYRIDGDRDAVQRDAPELAGYRESAPVRFGNHACRQHQLDGFGFVCDCVQIYLEHGGPWKEAYWQLVKRIADHIVGSWREPDNGLWELAQRRQYVSGKVMAWVGLDRAVKIAKRIGRMSEATPWRDTMPLIHDDVMQRGWREHLQTFVQHYDDDALDSSVLLISVMGFLPPRHPRVLSTITRIEAELTLDGFVYRFDPRRTLGNDAPALRDFEGAFLPCTFWLATAYAKAGDPERAERILERAEALAGEQGWFGEAVDPRSMTFRGNFPLLFSQVEYVRAVTEVAKARPLEMAAMAMGKVASRVERVLGNA